MFKKYTFHVDDGHAWLRVPIEDLRELGLLKRISRFSFIAKSLGYAFLEEDGDTALFVEAATAKGWSIEWDEIDEGSESLVRSLPGFKRNEF